MIHTPATHVYGDHPSQVVDVYLPAGDDVASPFPVAVLLHGGFWRDRFDRSLMAPLAGHLVDHGIGVVNVEYRRLGELEVGWPDLFDDVAAAIDALVGVLAHTGADLDRVAAIGHSAGGHLALWAATRTAPLVKIAAVAGLAPVTDLIATAEANLGDGATAALMGGGPIDVPERYAAASPAEHLPLGVPQRIAHGNADDRVPVSMSELYVERAIWAGDDVSLEVYEGVDHFAVIDPASAAWADTYTWLRRVWGLGRGEALHPYEKRILASLPAAVGSVVAASDHNGFIGMLKEANALAKSIEERPHNELIDSLGDIDDHIGEFQEKLERRPLTLAQLQAAVIAESRSAARILAEKAERHDADEYKRWVMDVGRRVAEAARDGFIIGIGKGRVSEQEAHLLAMLDDAIQAPRAEA